jgi:acetate kinase
MSGCVAVVNAGSSSIKFAIYDADEGEALLFRGKVEGIGAAPKLEVDDAEGRSVAEHDWGSQPLDHAAATAEILRVARELIAGRPVLAVGHRVVHGGVAFDRPARIDAGVVDQLRALIPLAPLHQPHNIAPIEAIAAAAPHIPQVACFDTAFHRAQPALAQLFALPRKYAEAGVRRYGFHGLSYEFVSGRLRTIAPGLAEGRVVIAHLGNGASLCALRAGRSVATTMGFTALEGLVMGTRSGALDPGVILHLMDVFGLGARQIEDLLYRRSGLLGVSGVSSDMRALRASSAPEAAEAISLFVYRIVREVGSMAAALGGLDGIVFTGGIGENDARTRAEVAAGCAWLGLELDEAANGAGGPRISREASRLAGWVVPTDEERVIARHTRAALATA